MQATAAGARVPCSQLAKETGTSRAQAPPQALRRLLSSQRAHAEAAVPAPVKKPLWLHSSSPPVHADASLRKQFQRRADCMELESGSGGSGVAGTLHVSHDRLDEMCPCSKSSAE